ncbi:MAG: hypothetical protein AAFW84_12705 [Cyanobacteria bacterium J06635_15]
MGLSLIQIEAWNPLVIAFVVIDQPRASIPVPSEYAGNFTISNQLSKRIPEEQKKGSRRSLVEVEKLFLLVSLNLEATQNAANVPPVAVLRLIALPLHIVSISTETIL